MRRISLFTLFLLLAGLIPVQAGHSPPKVLLRVYVQTNEGLPESEARPISIPPDNEVIQVRPLPELTEGDLVSVEADAVGAVHLHFNHSGQITLNACTAENQGKILVVMVDGFIVYAPTIDEQLSEGELVLPHPLKPEVVKLLQETAAHNVKQAART
jgi:preprotein translocase subunit SecD